MYSVFIGEYYYYYYYYFVYIHTGRKFLKIRAY